MGGLARQIPYIRTVEASLVHQSHNHRPSSPAVANLIIMSSSVASRIFVLIRKHGSDIQPLMFQVVSRTLDDTTGESLLVARPLTEVSTLSTCLC